MNTIQTSKAFKLYIEMFPDSLIAKQYERYGDMYLNSAGHFCTALWKGEIEEAISRADNENTIRMKKVLGVL